VLVVGDREDMDGAGARAASMPFLGLGRGPGFRDWEGVKSLLASIGV
jgi:hypothetical protein